MIYLASGATDSDKPAVLWSNALARASLAASSTAAGSAAANVLGPQTFDWWKPSAMPATLTATFGAAETCDALAVAAHTLGSSGATIYAERWTGSAWAVAASAAPTDDSALMLIWPYASSTQWRVRLTGATAPALGLVFLGSRLIFPAEILAPYTPADMAQRVELMAARSLTGHYLGASVFRRGLEQDVSFSPVPRAFVDGDLAGFRAHYDQGGTFFFAGGAAAMPRDLAYCWRGEGAGELRPSYAGGAAWAELKMGLAGYGA